MVSRVEQYSIIIWLLSYFVFCQYPDLSVASSQHTPTPHPGTDPEHTQ